MKFASNPQADVCLSKTFSKQLCVAITLINVAVRLWIIHEHKEGLKVLNNVFSENWMLSSNFNSQANLKNLSAIKMYSSFHSVR